MNDFFCALSFLTRIAIPFKIKWKEDSLSRSLKYYPLVGSVIGIALVLCRHLFSYLFSNILSSIFLLLVHVCITGGIHLDGLADTADGIFSGREKTKILKIMHDSVIGSFGTITLIFILLLKFNLFMETAKSNLALLILMPVISRFLAAAAAYRYPLADSSKLGKKVKTHLEKKDMFLAGIYFTLISLFTAYIFSFSIMTVAFIILFNIVGIMIFIKYIIKRIDGLSGDVYGAVIEISEVLVLTAYLIR